MYEAMGKRAQNSNMEMIRYIKKTLTGRNHSYEKYSFCGNSKVFDGVLTCMLSVLKEHMQRSVLFYIFTMDMTRIRPEYTPISEDMTDFLERVAKNFIRRTG